MLVTLILPQLIFQCLGDGKAYGGKNWQGWRGSFRQYREKMESRYNTDKDIIAKLKLATTKEEQENIMLGASDEMRQYANSVGMSIEKMEKFNEQAKASAHPLQALKANIKGIGKAFLSYSIQFAAFWGVSKFIEWVVNGIDAQVNALKYATEAAENLNKAYEDMNTTQKQNTKTVEEYGKTWEKLKDGVDEQGKNVSLSDDEYEQYKESINQIVSILPGITSGWDASNNAILMNVQSMDELNAALEEYAQKQREQILSGDETKAFQSKAGQIDLAEETQTLDYAKTLISAIKSNNVEGIKETLDDVFLQFDLKGGNYIAEALNHHGFAGFNGDGDYSYKGVPSTVSDDINLLTRSEQLLDELENYVTSNSESVESITQGWKDIATTWTAIQFSSAPSKLNASNL